MKNLNDICRAYLENNGISQTFCAEWCGCERSRFQKWLSGQRPIDKEIEKNVLLFLRGDYLVTLDDLVSLND